MFSWVKSCEKLWVEVLNAIWFEEVTKGNCGEVDGCKWMSLGGALEDVDIVVFK